LPSCKLITIAQLRDLEGEICQMFHIVPNDERTNAWNSRARGLVVRPFPTSKGETRADPRRTAGCLFNSK